MTYRPDDATESATGRRTEIDEDAAETFGRVLYEIMESLETEEPPGPPWRQLPESYKPWYRECASALITHPLVLELAKEPSCDR